jgi:hypothetical protein
LGPRSPEPQSAGPSAGPVDPIADLRRDRAEVLDWLLRARYQAAHSYLVDSAAELDVVAAQLGTREVADARDPVASVRCVLPQGEAGVICLP